MLDTVDYIVTVDTVSYIATVVKAMILSRKEPAEQVCDVTHGEADYALLIDDFPSQPQPTILPCMGSLGPGYSDGGRVMYDDFNNLPLHRTGYDSSWNSSWSRRCER